MTLKTPSNGDASRRKMKQTFANNLKPCLRHLVVYQIVYKRDRILPFFKISGWTQCNLLRLRLRRRYKKYRAITELRSIADHCTCTTAWSQRSCSFDRPVRTGDVITGPSCALARPVENRNVWTRPLIRVMMELATPYLSHSFRCKLYDVFPCSLHAAC